MNDTDHWEQAVSCVDDVLITTELSRRAWRAPDYASENRALNALAEEMSSRPERVLERLAELAMELCHADSAGISVLEPGGENEVFRWHVAVGRFATNLGGSIPREGSPCGTVMARNEVLLFDSAERFFPALRGVEPRIYENLLAPWTLNGEVAGTLWVIQHTPEGRFDAEDARLLSSLARFASAAHQTVAALEAARFQREALEQAVAHRTRELREREQDLAAELSTARQLAAVATELIESGSADELFAAVLDATRAIAGSEFSSIQLLSSNGGANELRLLAIAVIAQKRLSFSNRSASRPTARAEFCYVHAVE